MTRVYLTPEERWPDWTIMPADDDDHWHPADFSDEEIADFNEVERRYNEWQERLDAIAEAQNKTRPPQRQLSAKEIAAEKAAWKAAVV